MTLTPRDLDIAVTLARRVRLMTLDDLVRVWWAESYSFQTAWHRLRELAAGGWVQLARVNLRTVPATDPLFVWSPDRPAPDAGAVSAAARARWAGPAVPTAVAYAGRRAANVYGSTAGRPPAVNHRDHDAHLGAVYAGYRERRPHEADHWVGEDARPKAGFRVKDPDALLVDAEGRTYRVIESAGGYSPDQVEAFHAHCADLDLPYELW
jgi:hypothetical protein